MHAVFVIPNPVFFRFIDGIVRELICDGVDVTVLYRGKPNAAMLRCREDSRGVVFQEFGEQAHVFNTVVTLSRHLRAYLHWLHPERRWPYFLRHRYATTGHGFPRWLRAVVRTVGLAQFESFLTHVPLLMPLLKAIERCIPPNPGVCKILRELKPNVVVCCPVIYPYIGVHTTEVEFFKAAKSLELLAVALVASWDNLSMKGTFWIPPDLVLVWNETQRTEAAELHQVESFRVVPTGAPIFDDWFTSKFVMERSEFHQLTGLPADASYVLYATSSDASGDERPLVTSLVDSLRAQGAPNSLRIMVRPHPSRRDMWQGFEHAGVLVWPTTGQLPDTPEAKRALYNSMHYSIAVVGVNTSVFVEAAILDRPCIAITAEHLRHFQSDLLHFHYLTRPDVLETVPNASDCAARILDILRRGDTRQAARRTFVRSFVRPVQDGRSAARVAADVLLEVGRAGRFGIRRDSSPQAVSGQR